MKLFFLKLQKGVTPKIFTGVRTVMVDGNQEALPLAIIHSLTAKKTRAVMCKNNPPIITKGKVFEAHFHLLGGKKFSDPNTFLTVMKPKGSGDQIAILSEERWPEIGYQKIFGSPNGTVAPGLQIMKPMDSVSFQWENKTYQISNFAGEPNLSDVTPRTTHKPFADLQKKLSKV